MLNDDLILCVHLYYWYTYPGLKTWLLCLQVQEEFLWEAELIKIKPQELKNKEVNLS